MTTIHFDLKEGNLFLRFLVSDHGVEPNDIVGALAEQERCRSFLPQVVVENSAILPIVVLDAWESAGESNAIFLELLVADGQLSAQQKQGIAQKWIDSAPAIEDILVTRDVISEAKLSGSRQEFQDRLLVDRSTQAFKPQ